MSNYHRAKIPGGLYFFTVVSHNRRPILCRPKVYSKLQSSFKKTAQNHPFRLKAIVVLPDHLHCIWQLPEGDTNYSMRWNLIKRQVSCGIHGVANNRREKQIWQRRFWEHSIRDQNDYVKHLDYIHYNPVKHQLVKNPSDWTYSSFQYYKNKGFYDESWGIDEEPEQIKSLVFE